MLVDVIAVGLHPRVRSQADGSHYTSTGALPLIPGIDGVGRGADGKLRYFVLDDTQIGSLAEIEAKTMALSSVEQAWTEAAHTSERIVLTPHARAVTG